MKKLVLALIVASIIFAAFLISQLWIKEPPLGLRVALEANKLYLGVGESATFKLTITNARREVITLYSAGNLFRVEIYGSRGELIAKLPEVVLLILRAHQLEPGESYSEEFEYEFTDPGQYKVIGFAEFTLQDPSLVRKAEEVKLRADPIVVIVK